MPLPIVTRFIRRAMFVLLVPALLTMTLVGCAGTSRHSLECPNSGCADLVFHRISEEPVAGWKAGSDEAGRPVFLDAVVTIAGTEVEQVRLVYDDFGQPAVWIKLGKPAGERLREASAALFGLRMGIVVDGQMITSPYLRGVIADDIQISGIGTHEEAMTIVRRLTGERPTSTE